MSDLQKVICECCDGNGVLEIGDECSDCEGVGKLAIWSSLLNDDVTFDEIDNVASWLKGNSEHLKKLCSGAETLASALERLSFELYHAIQDEPYDKNLDE